MRRSQRNAGERQGIAPAPNEIVRSTEIAVVEQIQEQIEETMEEASVTREQLASGLGLTRAMVDHVLDAPDATLHDLAAFAAVLGVSFKVTKYRSRS